MKEVRLNLGSGTCPMDGWDNIDIKNGKLAYPLDVQDNSVDVIRVSHLLEHYGSSEVIDVVNNWVSKIKDGGKLMIAVPDFEKIAKGYLNKETINVSGYVMGGQTDTNDFHKTIFDKSSLTQLLEKAGLMDVQEWKSEINDCAALPVSLNLCGIKKSSVAVKRRIEAIISMPRLCFADSMDCMMTEIVSRGIPLKKGTGVFWSQCLTRMFEECLSKNTYYILTLDYDSWFRWGHVQKLLTLMEKNPDIDALFPVQMKRETDCPMMGLVDENGKRRDFVNHAELEADILPALTGHFGLTLFRASCFEKLKKPWFIGQPDKDGSWNDNRVDDDIYFWNNFRECGCKAAIAPKVNIGHLQLVCTFPGHYKDNYKCINSPLSTIGDVKNVPDHCRWDV